MRIVNAVYGDSTGGRWAATIKTARLLAGRGHEVILLIDPCDQDKVPDFGAERIEVVTLRNSGHYDLLASVKAARLLRQRAVDAVIAHSGRAVHLLKRAAPAQVPVIAFNHSHNIKRTLKADAFFCITPYMKQIVDAATGGTKPAHVISNAVSVPAESELRREGDGRFSIGAISRLVEGKGLDTLVAALALLARRGIDFRATIAGDGELRPALERLVEEALLADRVEVPGWLDEAGKAAFYRSVDVVCYTSGRDVQPLTVLEAFGWGKALVGTDVLGGSSCYVNEETALVTRVGNPEQLADALERLSRDADMRARLGRNAREQAMLCYADEVVAEMLDTRIRELVAERGGHRG
ncbi:MAG: glycosyltransferase family 4 protein [Thauera sp.]|nr:glycosyltransferase family 4 protein [Thauera sp.]